MNPSPLMGAGQLPHSDLTAPTPDRRLPVVDKRKVDPAILQAAQGMETMFLDLMMKEMRKTVEKNDLDLESPATEIYRNMMDSENTQKAVKAGGVGLADQIVAYLQGERYNRGQMEHEAPGANAATTAESPSTGGTHESRTDRK